MDKKHISTFEYPVNPKNHPSELSHGQRLFSKVWNSFDDAAAKGMVRCRCESFLLGPVVPQKAM